MALSSTTSTTNGRRPACVDDDVALDKLDDADDADNTAEDDIEYAGDGANSASV
jgi:hypothetical protein